MTELEKEGNRTERRQRGLNVSRKRVSVTSGLPQLSIFKPPRKQ